VLKVKTIKVNHDKLKFSYDINLSGDKIFYTVLPANVRELAEQFGVMFNRVRNKDGYLHNKTFDGLYREVKEIINKITSKKLIKEEVVLKYEIVTQCTYCKTKAGEIVPNGSYQELVDGVYAWICGTEAIHSANSKPFGFLIYVEPKLRSTYEYFDKSITKEYRRVGDEETEKDDVLKWLNGICSISSIDHWENNVKEVLYTPAVGLFFKKALMFIFNFNEKFSTILNEKKEIDFERIKQLTAFYPNNPRKGCE